MAIPRNVFGQLAECILEGGARKATKYLSSNEVVKATLRGEHDTRARIAIILFTVGRPNHAERKFIAACKRAGERFPVRKIQLRWPVKRASVVRTK